MTTTSDVSTATVEAFAPRALFLAAHHTTWSGAYFLRVLEVASLGSDDDHVVAVRGQLTAVLKDEQTEAVRLVRVAHQLALAHGVQAGTPPRVPGEWDPWSRRISRGFQTRLDPDIPASRAFPLGWTLGQVRTTLALVATLVDVHRGGVDRQARIVEGLRTIVGLVVSTDRLVALLAPVPGADDVAEGWHAVGPALQSLGQADAGATDDATLAAVGQQARRAVVAVGELAALATRVLPGEHVGGESG